MTKSEEIVNRIEQKVRSQSDNEINSEYIGSLVMDELADLDEITYVRFASVYRSFKDVGELETLLKQITEEPRRKGKIDEAQYAFRIFKNNLLPPAGAALEQYYLPILEMETVTVYRYLLASYDQGEKQYLLAQILNHLNIGFPQLLLAFDRLIAMGLIDLYEGRVGITIQLHAPSCVGRIFSDTVFKRLLEKDWGKGC